DHVAVVDHQDGGQGQGGAGLAGQLVDGQDVVNRRLLLPAATAHDRVHRELSLRHEPAAASADNTRFRCERAAVLHTSPSAAERRWSIRCTDDTDYQTRPGPLAPLWPRPGCSDTATTAPARLQCHCNAPPRPGCSDTATPARAWLQCHCNAAPTSLQ